MLYIGLDVHSKWMTIKGFDPETGRIIEMDRVPNDEASLANAFRSLAGPLHAAMESGTNSWAVYRTIEPYFERLIVVDPATVWGKKARRIAKTDKKDAMELAMKMQRGDLKALYVPDVHTQDLRSLARAKINATRHITKLVNEIGSQLRSWGIIVEYSLLSVRGEKLIEESRAKLPEHSQMILDAWLEMLKQAQATEGESSVLRECCSMARCMQSFVDKHL